MFHGTQPGAPPPPGSFAAQTIWPVVGSFTAIKAFSTDDFNMSLRFVSVRSVTPSWAYTSYDMLLLTCPLLPSTRRYEVCRISERRLPPSTLRRPKSVCTVCVLLSERSWLAHPNEAASWSDMSGLLQLTVHSPSGSPVVGLLPVPAPMKAPLGAICATESSSMNMNSL